MKRLLSFIGSRLLSRTSSASSSASTTCAATAAVKEEGEGRPLLPVTVPHGNGNGAVGAAAEMGARLAGAGAGRTGGEYGATTTSTTSSSDRGRSSSGKKASRSKRPRFLILDFRRVTAVDMSSVVNCWLPLQSLCRDMGVVLVYAHCNLRVRVFFSFYTLLYVRVSVGHFIRPTDGWMDHRTPNTHVFVSEVCKPKMYIRPHALSHTLIHIYYTHKKQVEFYLRSHRLIDDTNTHLLPTLHQALDFCETALLQVNLYIYIRVYICICVR